MTEALYDNPAHWKEMHLRFSGSLKAVGRSGLSETYNLYKYRSEEATFSEALAKIIFKGKNITGEWRVLDIGAGTGYWLSIVKEHAALAKMNLSMTALDLSEQALDALKNNVPGAECIIENAGTADTKLLASRYDLVMANYCLHHITVTAQFKNALQLAINSVKPGGYLLLMDCLIDRSFSPYYDVDADNFTGSGLSRPLKWVDQACEEKNMRRIHMADPISYLMNNVLESDSPSGFRVRRVIWKILHRLYRSERISRWLMPLVFPLDRFLKSRNIGYSTRLLIYQRQVS